MAMYSQFVKLRYLDPVSDLPNKTEFKLPPSIKAYPNLRLSNVGLKGATGNLGPVGCIGMIRHIHLYSNKQLLDSVRFVNRYMDFKNKLSSNSQNKNIKKYLNKAQYGYEITDKQQFAHLRANSTVDSVGLEKNFGYIELTQVFNILSELKVIDTDVFENLRLVIEWETDSKYYMNKDNVTGQSHVSPILVMDEITSDQLANALKKEQKNFLFQSIDHDSLVFPDVTPADPANIQSKDTKLNAYQNRVINRIVMMKAYTDVAKNFVSNNIQGRGPYSSPAMTDESVNFKINGQTIFDQPLDNDMIKLAMTTDTYGPLNVMPYESVLSNGLASPETAGQPGNEVASPADTNLIGNSSYLGVKIMDRIQDFEVSYQRKCHANTTTSTLKRYSDGITLHFYAEVQKMMKFGAGSFSVAYL